MNEARAFDVASGVGQRSTTYRFELIDGATGAHLGEIHPSRATTPTLSHDTTSTITRRVQGLTLLPEDASRFRPLVDRIAITMVVDGVGEYPLGRYVPSDDIRVIQTDGVSGVAVSSLRPLSLYDEMIIVDQPLPDSFAADGSLISEVIRSLLSGLPINEPLIDACSQTSDVGWSAGTSRASALQDLCASGGYFAPWFDHSSTLRCIRAFDPAATVPAFDLDAAPSMIRGSITITDESVNAPNRFVIISNDTGESQEPIVGIYDVPSTAPHSILNRGFVLPDVRDAQTTTYEQAQVYARTIGIQQTIAEKLEFETPPDPRHDGYDVVQAFGERWLEIGWTITLTGGGTMRHVLSRTYPASDEGV